MDDLFGHQCVEVCGLFAPTIVICTDECCVFVVLDERGLSVHETFHLDQARLLIHTEPACRVSKDFVPGYNQTKYHSEIVTTNITDWIF